MRGFPSITWVRNWAWIVLAAAAAPPAVAQPQFQGLDRLSGYSAYAPLGIAADGSIVVGVTKVDPQTIFPFRAFRWSADTGLSVLPTISTIIPGTAAHAISADGSLIVGQNHNEAYGWSGTGQLKMSFGLYETPPRQPGFSYGASAHAASADGSVVVGSSSSNLGQHAFRWTAATGMTSLGYLPGTTIAGATDTSADGSVVVGWATTPAGPERPFRWTAATGMQELTLAPSPAPLPRATAVSADGSTVVGWTGPPDLYRAFRWTQAGGAVEIGALGDWAQAFDVSADGRVIVGAAEDGAFIWDPAHGIRPVKSVLTAAGVDLTGWDLTGATAVSADGSVITGHGLNPAGQPEAWIARIDVPEPNMLPFLLAGCVISQNRLLKRRNPCARKPCPSQ